MTNIVKEFKTMDGLGAMLWKKIYAMSYAKYHKKIFKDTPIDWFLIHKSDGIDGEDDPKYKDLMYKFNNVLYHIKLYVKVLVQVRHLQALQLQMTILIS